MTGQVDVISLSNKILSLSKKCKPDNFYVALSDILFGFFLLTIKWSKELRTNIMGMKKSDMKITDVVKSNKP